MISKKLIGFVPIIALCLMFTSLHASGGQGRKAGKKTGILLVAFPVAHGDILTALYLPVAVMLIGLILRGVAFEFRAKAPLGHKRPWDVAFWAGSLMTALAQGFMLGMYVMGLEWTWPKVAFALGTAGALAVAYSFIGAAWVILKTDGLKYDLSE